MPPVIKKFIEYARARASTCDQKEFRADLVAWYEAMDVGEQDKITESITKGQVNLSKYWLPLTYQMLQLFKSKRGVKNCG